MVNLVNRIEGDLKSKKPSEVRSQLVKEGYKEKEVDEAFTKYYSKQLAPEVIKARGKETFGPGDAAVTVVVIGLLVVGYIYGVPLLKEKGLWPDLPSISLPSQASDSSQATDSSTAADTQNPTESSINAEGVKEFSMIAKKFEFLPNEIHVKKGDKVRLKIKSIDVQHGFRLADFGVEVTLEPNQEKVVEFTATKAGTFDFYCSVFCGTGHGNMRGLLFVEP